MAIINNFQNITELYNHLLPAIRTKINDLERMHIDSIKEIDVWSYCINNIWNKKSNLNIYEMVNDILFLDELDLINKRKENR